MTVQDENAKLDDDVKAVLNLPSTSRILEAAAALTGVRFAAIARVTPDRWIACASLDRLDFGLRPGDELDIGTTFCIEVRGRRKAVVIDDVDTDPIFRDHPTPRQYGFKSYISVPIITTSGEFFGTLCGLDPEARRLNTPKVLESFALFADLIAAQLDTHRAFAEQGRQLRSERSFGRLREEFIAMLGHDLRNPVSAVLAGVRILGRKPLDAETEEVVDQIGASARRMDDLIRDLLDLTRGRLGGGIPVDIDPEADIRDEFEQVIAEIETATGREIRSELDCGSLPCDRARLGQLLSNLLSNAVTHGAPDAPVTVTAAERNGQFALSVTNIGDPIPEELLPTLFKPFNRGPAGSTGSGRGGLGLGLYIASEIARAHGGRLTATSQDGNVSVTMTMPLPPRGSRSKSISSKDEAASA